MSGDRITAASLCAASWSETQQECRVSSQLILDRKPQQNIFKSGASAWTKEDLSPTGAATLTPLASVSWDGGKEVRLFYLNSDAELFDFALVSGSTVWKMGTLKALKLQATPSTALAATVFHVPNTATYEIRVYYQDGDGAINEVFHGGNPNDTWKHKGAVPTGTDPLLGTALATVAYTGKANGARTNLFYQGKDLQLYEIIFDGSWKKGDFIPVVATGRTPIAATTFAGSGGRAVQAYWRNPKGKVIYRQSLDNIWEDDKKTSDQLPAGYGLAVIQWAKGYNLRLYFQDFEGPEIVQWGSNDGGATWIKVSTF